MTEALSAGMAAEAEGLIDRIYEAAVIPDLWPDLLSDIARYGGGEEALIFTIADGVQKGIMSPGARENFEAYTAARWEERSDRPARISAARHHGFITDLDVYSAAELQFEPVYQEFLIPRGWGWGIGTSLPVPSGEQLFVTVERAWARGPAGADEVMRMDALRPHLARAALMTSRLNLERAQAVSDAFQSIGLPACVLNGHCRAIAMNSGCQSALGVYVRDASRFSIINPQIQPLFDDAWATLSSDHRPAPRSIPIPAHGDHPAAVLHLIPIRRAAHDFFPSSAAIVVITPVGARDAPSLGVLEGLFDLTPAEARVAREVARLAAVDDIASAFGSGRETIRSQLKSVFAKTGTRRQAELAALLTGATLR